MKPMEINAEIAKIKGLKNVRVKFGSRLWHDPVVGVPDGYYGNEVNWAENIEDAWELFEEMRDKLDCDISLRSCGAAWIVECSTIEYETLSPTAPMAIALAWLKWKEG